MGTVELLNMLSIVFLVFGSLFLLGAVIEYFGFGVGKIIQNLSGTAKKKEIQAMEYGIEQSGRIKRNVTYKKKYIDVSEKDKHNQIIDYSDDRPTDVLNEADSETSLLGQDEDTVVLEQATTQELESETTVLAGNYNFVIQKKMILTHTDEVI